MSVGGTEELLIGPGEESCVYYADIRTKQGYSVKVTPVFFPLKFLMTIVVRISVSLIHEDDCYDSHL